MIELELAEIVKASRKESSSTSPQRRTDKLMPAKRGKAVKGHVTWSIKFYPLWKMDVEPSKKEMGIPPKKSPLPDMIWPIRHLPLPAQELAKAVVEGEEMAGEKESVLLHLTLAFVERPVQRHMAEGSLFRSQTAQAQSGNDSMANWRARTRASRATIQPSSRETNRKSEPHSLSFCID